MALRSIAVAALKSHKLTLNFTNTSVINHFHLDPWRQGWHISLYQGRLVWLKKPSTKENIRVTINYLIATLGLHSQQTKTYLFVRSYLF
jgi:hypothetical protein